MVVPYDRPEINPARVAGREIVDHIILDQDVVGVLLNINPFLTVRSNLERF
jgi:hypothetical protein